MALADLLHHPQPHAGVRLFQRILGLLAQWCGLEPRREISLGDFVRDFRLEHLPPNKVIFTAADDARLRAL
jgi:hypothetical protein